MTESNTLLGKPYQDLYTDYYARDAMLKRELSAAQTVDCMAAVLEPEVAGRLLDVGAGEGSVLLQLSRRGLARELHAMEISESGVAAIKDRDITNLAAVQLFDGYTHPIP
jgi:precorrin-6B methylase 2